jgi:hypothetical protein
MNSQHFLIVHDHPDDGMEVEHPDCCPTAAIYDGRVLVHTCEVGWHEEQAGLDLFFHRDQPHPHSRDSVQVAVGRHPIEAWSERTGRPGAWEHDGGLRLLGGES